MFLFDHIDTEKNIRDALSSLRISAENISETAPEHLMLVQKYQVI